MRTVRCTTPDCPSAGLVRTVPDRRAGPGVVYRPALICEDCGFELPERDRSPVVETTTRNPPETAARKTKAPAKRTTKRKG